MKKNYKILHYLTALSLLIFSIFIGNCNASADELKEGLNIIGVNNDGTIDIDFWNNDETSISLDNNDYYISCNSSNASLLDINNENNVCFLRVNNFGRGSVIIEVYNNDYSEYYKKSYFFDTGIEDYMENIMDRIPNEIDSNINYYDYINSLLPDIFWINTASDNRFNFNI